MGDNEDIQMATTYNDRVICRRNKKTGEIIQKNGDKKDVHENEWVKADAGLHCRVKDYPTGDNDTDNDYMRKLTLSGDDKEVFIKGLRRFGNKYSKTMKM